ncbi:hypothetical protein SAY87_015749 [Trapa incisa]|uniref:Uncharacterized protein n=1 Tax=Trapa incisa TaxID=236973 RepID=A0AAN7QYC2_9MYRT|nr:hypothetical protein SAY87_015749 [Trapa incisa]
MAKLTGKGDGAADSEDASFAAVVTELAIRVTGKDLAAVAAEELDGGGGGRGGARRRVGKEFFKLKEAALVGPLIENFNSSRSPLRHLWAYYSVAIWRSIAYDDVEGIVRMDLHDQVSSSMTVAVTI